MVVLPMVLGFKQGREFDVHERGAKREACSRCHLDAPLRERESSGFNADPDAFALSPKVLDELPHDYCRGEIYCC
jgi:hypothetical protein